MSSLSIFFIILQRLNHCTTFWPRVHKPKKCNFFGNILRILAALFRGTFFFFLSCVDIFRVPGDHLKVWLPGLHSLLGVQEPQASTEGLYFLLCLFFVETTFSWLFSVKPKPAVFRELGIFSTLRLWVQFYLFPFCLKCIIFKWSNLNFLPVFQVP